MDLLSASDPGVVPSDLFTAFIYALLKILAYGALAIVLVGVITTCWCCLFECRKWRRCQGRSEFWRISGS